jgi:glutamyl-tRNA reductase
MPLIAVGVNHRTAPVDVRERLSVAPARMLETLDELRALDGIDGAAVLSTCNRVEMIVSAAGEDVIEPIVNWLMRRAGTARGELEKHVYILRHSDVLKHLFRVASGLDSMIVGEPQIAGQVRAAFQASRERGALDSLLSQVFVQTMRVAKKVRTDTGIGEHAVSVPYAAVELARKIFGDLRGLQVLLLGAGEMGELTAEHLSAFGLSRSSSPTDPTTAPSSSRTAFRGRPSSTKGSSPTWPRATSSSPPPPLLTSSSNAATSKKRWPRADDAVFS